MHETGWTGERGGGPATTAAYDADRTPGQGADRADWQASERSSEREDGATVPDAAQVTWRDLSWEELLVEADRLGRDPRFGSLSDAALEARLSTDRAAIDAAMCRWLELLGELVVRRVWAEQGARTPGAWLSWRLGVGASTAREHVRVALRLREFPATRDRFAAGTLSYSKVRSITRCGDPSCEDLLLAWADDATAAQLESVARGFRTAERARRDAARHEEDADVAFSTRARTFGDGTRELTLRGPAELVAELEQAVERLAELHASERAIDHPAEHGPRTDASAGPELDDAAVRPLVSARDRVEAAVDAVVAAAAAEAPPDTSGLDRHTLVLHVAADDLVDPRRAVASPPPRSGSASAEAVEASSSDRGVTAAADPSGRVRAMDRTTLRRLACEAGITLVATDRGGNPVDVGRRRRRTTAALRRAVHRRDRDRCTFPGCSARRHLHAHHVEHWADGGPTDLANLVLVCGFHHRFVHAAGWSIEVRADGRHRYRPPVGQAVERVPRPPGASPGAVAAAAPPTASAGALLPPTHLGGPFDLDVAVATLQRHHELARRSLDLAA